MSRIHRVLAGGALAATIGLFAASVVLSVLGNHFGVSDIGWLLGQAAFAVVGSLLLFRQPRNLVGRILVASGVFALLQALLWRYAALAFAAGSTLPFGIAAGWLGDWVYVPMFPLFIVLLPLYFPDGKLPSPRWRPVVWVTVGLTGFTTFYLATAPGMLEDFPVANPVTLAVTVRIAALLDAVGGEDILISGFFALAVAAAVSVVLRYRRAAGVERLQIKWFAWTIGSFVGYLVVQALLLEVILNRPGNTVTDLIGLAFLLGVPVSIGIAVLRYRLYDIDRIVSRTVTYGLLTVLLGGIYLTAVTGLTAVTAPVAGDSPVAVAAATLLAAAAFGPTRRRIQAIVDRRFNRARYDAAKAVESYRTTLREEVDIEALSGELLGAVRATVQPVQSTLWLRETS